MIELRYYVSPEGRSPFELWFSRLNAQAAVKVTVTLSRLELGNLSNVKSVGSGVHECRIDWGPGYRVYFGRQADAIVIVLTGGSKHRQQDDIVRAKAMWADYRQRLGKA